jgi:hypothetical protein
LINCIHNQIYNNYFAFNDYGFVEIVSIDQVLEYERTQTNEDDEFESKE